MIAKENKDKELVFKSEHLFLSKFLEQKVGEIELIKTEIKQDVKDV